MKSFLSTLVAALFLAAVWIPAVESCPGGNCDPAKCAKMHKQGGHGHKCPGENCDPAKCAKMHEQGGHGHKCPGENCDPAKCAKMHEQGGHGHKCAGENCDPAKCAKMHEEGGLGHKCPGAKAAEAAAAGNLVVDPVCGMTIDKEEAAAQVEYEGRTYYFCRLEGKETFLADPAKYLTER